MKQFNYCQPIEIAFSRGHVYETVAYAARYGMRCLLESLGKWIGNRRNVCTVAKG